MVYHRHGIGLSKEQARKLARGHTIKLSHSHLKGGSVVHLTRTQLHKLAKAHHARRGATLKMSMAQLRHNCKMGAGFFSNLAKTAAKSLASVAVNKGLPALANLAQSQAQNYLNKKIAGGRVKKGSKHVHKGEGFFDNALSMLGSVAQQAAPLLINAGIKRLTGTGMKGVGVRKTAKKEHKGKKHVRGGSFLPAGY